MKLNLSAVLLIFLIVFSPQISLAAGSNFSYVQGAKTLSLGGLYFGGSEGVSNIISNPAGLGFLSGREINLNIVDYSGEQQFNNPPRSDFHSFKDDNININGGAFWSISENITIAAGYNKLLDYLIKWPFVMYRQQDSSSAVTAFEFSNHMYINAFSPAVAVKFGKIAVGLSGSVYQVKQVTAFPQANNKWFQNIGEAAYQFNYMLDGWSFGFNLGVIGEVSSSLKIGASVKSGFKTDLSGNAKSLMFADLDSTASEVDINSQFEMPWEFGLGIIYSLNENVKVNVDGLYSLWGSFQKNINYNFGNSIWQAGLKDIDSVSGINAASFNLDYKNTLTAGVGIEIIPGGELTYRLGYKFSASPNSISTYNMLFPTVDQHWFSFGVGYVNEDISADLNITYGIGVKKEIINNYPSLTGEYSSSTLIPAITIRYQF